MKMATKVLRSPNGDTAVKLLYMISITGLFALLLFPISNGLFGATILQAQQHRIGIDSSAYNTTLTGLNKLDELLNAFTHFFHDLVEGSRADISLLMIPFGGSAMGIWVLGMVESNRNGNRGHLPSL